MTSRQADAKKWSFICDSHAQKGHFSQEVMIFRYKDRHTLPLYIYLYILESSAIIIYNTFTIYSWHYISFHHPHNPHHRRRHFGNQILCYLILDWNILTKHQYTAFKVPAQRKCLIGRANF